MALQIKGTIGYDVDGIDFANKISRCSGDIDFEIDSPGGSVFHGISIANAIKNYDRGQCRMHVVGDCSSMALYIAMFGDGDIEFEPNSIAVAHNPWSFAVGDYKAMQKEAEVLEQMAELYAQAFVRKGLFSKEEIRSIMDKETWFMGDNLKKLGTVLDDNKKDGGDNSGGNDSDQEPEEAKIAAFRMRANVSIEKLKSVKIDNEIDKVAALISPQKYSGLNPGEVKPNAQAAGNQKVSTTEKTEETEMVASLEELKTKYAAIYNEAKTDGVEAEKKRVASLMKFIDVDKQAVIKAIEGGVGIADDEFQASILMARTNKNEIKAMEKQNPGEINPKAETHAPEPKEGEDGEQEQTEEEKAKAKAEADKKEQNAILAAMGLEPIK